MVMDVMLKFPGGGASPQELSVLLLQRGCRRAGSTGQSGSRQFIPIGTLKISTWEIAGCRTWGPHTTQFSMESGTRFGLQVPLGRG